ncbi:MAG: hypothetical protein WAO57_13165 [Syntrophomonadaceae bacterium]
MNQKWSSLAELAGQSGFAELYTLVDELHCRRTEYGTAVEDYGHQTRLKSLIHLVHSYGERNVDSRQPDLQLLAALKEASRDLLELKPQGTFANVLASLQATWPELLVMFGALLAQDGLAEALGWHFASVQNYLQRQRLLYFAFVGGRERENRYVFSGQELRRLLGRTPLQALGWAGQLPLLPLEGHAYLLSPELLYDDLLQKYLELAALWAARCGRGHSLQVAEDP